MCIITSATARTVYIITALINKRSAGCAHKSARGRVRINVICTVDSKMQIRGPTAHQKLSSLTISTSRSPSSSSSSSSLLEGCALHCALIGCNARSAALRVLRQGGQLRASLSGRASSATDTPTDTPHRSRDTVVGRPAPHDRWSLVSHRPGPLGSQGQRKKRAHTHAFVLSVQCTSTAHCSLYVCSSVLPEMKKGSRPRRGPLYEYKNRCAWACRMGAACLTSLASPSAPASCQRTPI
jgi:hypothetical protein